MPTQSAFLILKSLLLQHLSNQQAFCQDTDFSLQPSILRVQNTKEREFPYPFSGQQKWMSNVNLSAILGLQTENVVKFGDRNVSVFQGLIASARWLFCIWLQSLHTHTHTLGSRRCEENQESWEMERSITNPQKVPFVGSMAKFRNQNLFPIK